MNDDQYVYAWGATYMIDGSDEGVSVIELFNTRGAAEKFLQRYEGRPDRHYKVTRFKIWTG